MAFMVLWFIGFAISIVTRIAINKLTGFGFDYYYIEECSSKHVSVIMNLLVIICIILAGGITNGIWIGNFVYKDIVDILPIIFLTSLIYVFGFLVLGLYKFSNKLSQVCFIAVFIISTIAWTIPIRNYNRNIETITETVITSTQERKLLYFCNIPVQDISGKISGSFVRGTGSISGSISTLDELSYWYANENNEGEYDSALASNSKIVFISDEEKPYVEIISYSDYTKTINHNNGRKDTTKNKEWEEFIFYLPEAIMQ